MSSRKVALFNGANRKIEGVLRLLAEDGYDIGVLSVSDDIKAITEELGGICVSGSHYSIVNLFNLIDLAMKKWSRVDLLFNSIESRPHSPVLETKDEEWHTGMDMCFLNVTRSTRTIMPLLQQQKFGLIVNYLGFTAYVPDPEFAVPQVFQEGLSAYARLFAEQYVTSNIRMNNLLPSLGDHQLKSQLPIEVSSKEEYFDSLAITAAVRFLMSNGGMKITGQSIRVDDGRIKSEH